MLKKLRNRYIIYTVILFSVIAIATVTGLFYNEYIRWQNITERALTRMIETAVVPQLTPRVGEGEANQLQVGSGKQIGVTGDDFEERELIDTFAITLNDDGSIQKTYTNSYTNIDAAIQVELVRLVFKEPNQNGVVYTNNYVFRYMLRGNTVAFADIRNEQVTLRELLISSGVAIVSAILLIFGISIAFANWAIKPVETAWHKQRQFVSDASHELRTPLTVILSNTDLLLENKHETIASQEKWLRYIETEAQRMKELVERLLFLAKSDQSGTSMTLERVNLSDAVYEVCLPLEPVVYERNKTMTLDIQPQVIIQGNLPYLKQLIVIFVDNAIKYSGENGKISVSLEAAMQKATLTVTNTGEVIPPDKIEHLFERFYRIDDSRQRETEGYGLGLSMAKTIVDGHNSKITVRSNLEENTKFIVTFPLAH